MNIPARKLFGSGLVLGLTALSLAAQNASQLANLPLWFEAGQPARYTAHASDSEFTISPAGAEFTLAKKTGETAGCQLQFVGANPDAQIAGDQKLTGTINYFLGSNPGGWRANVPTFAQVRVENLYPGVNVVYYGNRQKLEYDFNLAAGISPAVIALRFDGAENVLVNAQGELVIRFSSGEVVQHPPAAYQTIHGARQEIAASYKILDAHTAAFTLGHYDHNEPLVIDPVLSYSSYFGGNYGDTAWAIAVNTNNYSIYVAGQTFSTKDSNNIPPLFSTPGAFQTNYLGGKLAGDAFVARFGSEIDTDTNSPDYGNRTNLSLIYATYLGGSDDDAAYAIAVDSAGNAFITGATASTNFPIKNPISGGNEISGALNRQIHRYPTDAFVTELDPGGSNLVYSTYIGGNSSEAAYGIALDSDDNAFITGFTYSSNFPVTPYPAPAGAFSSHQVCSNTVVNANAFIAEIGTNGPTLNYSTYLGGTNYDVGRAIAYNNGMLFVAGYTFSTNFPATNSLPKMEFVYTNFYTKKVSGSFTNISGGVTNYGVVISNYFNGQYLNGCATNKHNARIDSASDAFVTAFAVVSPTNLSLLYSTFLGGTNDDQATSIAADANGSAYVAGWTVSTNFPYTNALSAFASNSLSFVHTNGYGYVLATNGFLTRIDWDGTNTSIGYSVMFGGRGADVANGVALDPANNAYVVGSASSTNFPVLSTNNISDFLTATNNSQKGRGFSDVFVIAFTNDASALLYSTYLGGRKNDFGNAIAVDGFGNAYITGQTLSTNFPVTTDSSNSISALQTHLNGTNDMFISIISISTNFP